MQWQQYGIVARDDDGYGSNMAWDKWPAINWWKHRGAVEESSGADIPVKSTKAYNTKIQKYIPHEMYQRYNTGMQKYILAKSSKDKTQKEFQRNLPQFTVKER